MGADEMRRIGSIVLAAMVVATALTQVDGNPVEAVAGSVEGIVQLRDAGVTEVFEGVTMTLTEGSSPGGAVVDTVTTIADGTYSLSVEEGIYTLRAEPPDSFGLTPTSRAVTVDPAGTTTENFLFTIVETKLTVSGVITGPTGSPIVGASVDLTGPDVADGGSAITDAAGAYSIEVLPRVFRVGVNVSTIDPFPDRYSLFATGVSINADTTLDIQVPGSTVTIDVVDDATGSPVTALVTASSRQPGPTILGVASTLNSELDQVSVSGSIEVVLAPGGTASAGATAAGYFPASEGFALPDTSTVTLRLVPEPDPDQTRLTGRLLDPDRNPVAGAQVLVDNPDPQPGTDANGEFDVVADAPLGGGPSWVELRSPSLGAGSTALPPLWQIRSTNVPHPEGGQTAIGDIVLDAEPVTINVVDPDGAAVPAAYFDASNFPVFPWAPAPFGPYSGEALTRYASDITSNSAGTMALRLIDNTGASGLFSEYQMTFAPPVGVDTCEFSAYNLVDTDWNFDVSGPTTVTVEMKADQDNPRCDGGPLVPETTVTGTLLLDGTPVERVFPGFNTIDAAGGKIRVGSETDPSGAFAADVIDGDHEMDVFWTFPTDVWPELRLRSDETVVAIDNATDPGPIDLGTFDVPLVDLAVTVLTPDGRPIPGVKVSTPKFPTVSFQMNGFNFTGTSSFPGSPSTGGSGEATLPLLPGTYDLRFTPAAGFVPFTLENVVLPPSGAGVQVQLAYPHAPPTAVITPTGTSTGVDTFEGTVMIEVAAEAFAGFAVDSVMVSVDGATATEYAGPFPVSSLGGHTIVVQVTDDGSVTGPPVTRSFTIVQATVPTEPTVTPTEPTVTPTEPTVTPTSPTSQPSPPTTVPTPILPATGLPETGGTVDLALAALLLLAGFVLLAIARRPRSA